MTEIKQAPSAHSATSPCSNNDRTTKSRQITTAAHPGDGRSKGTSALPAVPFFEGLSQRDLGVIMCHMVRKKLASNTLILTEGERTDSLYMITRGAVKAFLSDEHGKEIILNVHDAGEYFGEIALLDRAPRSASVMTMDETELLVISRDQFKRCFANNPEVALAVIGELTQRVRSLTENVRGLALLDVHGRVSRTLTYLSARQRQGSGTTGNLTQQDIANMVGASREMVNRVLRDLETKGYIEINKKHIVVRKELSTEFTKTTGV